MADDVVPSRRVGALVVLAALGHGYRHQVTHPAIDPRRLIVAEMAGLLNEAECYGFVPEEQGLDYLDRKARMLHRLVDVIGDESTRWVAQDAEGAAARARSVATTTFEDVLGELGL